MKECITPCYFFLSSPLKFISDKYSLTLFYTIFVIRRKNERKRKTEKEPKKIKSSLKYNTRKYVCMLILIVYLDFDIVSKSSAN